MKKIIILILLVLSGAAYGQLDSIKISTPNSGRGDPIRTSFKKTNLAITQVNTNTGNILLRLPISDTTLMLSKYLLKTTAGSLYANQMIYPASGIPLSSGTGWGTSITNNSANWNTAYGWGNHAGLYDATGTAAGVISTHQSTYNHSNYNTAYTDRMKWDGGSLDLVASTGRSSLGGTTIGQAFFTLANPSAITFPRINADNSVTALSAANFKTALSLSASDVGLGDVTNENKATMFTSPTFTTSVTLPATTNLPYGAILNFNYGDVTLTHGVNLLTIAGGNLALGTNNLRMTGTIASTESRVSKGWFTDIELTNLPTVGNNTLKSALAITASDAGAVALPDSSSTLGKKYATGLMLKNGLALKVNSADTSAMLLRYINKADTSAMLNDYINKADTANMLAPYASRQNINDSLDVLKAEAEVGISEADSLLRTTGGYSTYNNHLNGIENSWVHKEFAAASGIKAFPVAPYYAFSNGAAVTSGRCYYILYHVISTISTTGIKWANAGAGDYVAKDYNGFGLYSISGDTYTLIDSTVNNGNLWKGTALQLQTTDWANGAHVLTPGYYIVAAVWSAESAPAAAPQPYYIANVAAVFHNLFRVNGLGGNHRMVSYKNATTELPLTIDTADMTAAGTYIYAFLLY